jgi:hypothetical protein
LLFVAVQAIETKFRRSRGVTTANSTNKNPNVNKLSWAINYTPLRVKCKVICPWAQVKLESKPTASPDLNLFGSLH